MTFKYFEKIARTCTYQILHRLMVPPRTIQGYVSSMSPESLNADGRPHIKYYLLYLPMEKQHKWVYKAPKNTRQSKENETKSSLSCERHDVYGKTAHVRYRVRRNTTQRRRQELYRAISPDGASPKNSRLYKQYVARIQNADDRPHIKYYILVSRWKNSIYIINERTRYEAKQSPYPLWIAFMLHSAW